MNWYKSAQTTQQLVLDKKNKKLQPNQAAWTQAPQQKPIVQKFKNAPIPPAPPVQQENITHPSPMQPVAQPLTTAPVINENKAPEEWDQVPDTQIPNIPQRFDLGQNENLTENVSTPIQGNENLPIISQDDLNIQGAEPKQQGQFQKIQKPSESKQDAKEPQVPQQQHPDFKNRQLALRWALANKQTVWIKYDTQNGNTIQRNIQPHGIFNAGTHNRIVVAWDETAGGIRGFITKKIKDFKIIGRKFNNKFIFKPR